METLGLFLFKSIVVSGLLTTWYLLALRGTRLHKYNRIFLLSTLFASLVIPFFHFQLFSIHHSVTSSLAPVSLLGNAGVDANSSFKAIRAGQTQINWMLVAGIVAGAISLSLLGVLSFRIAKVRKMCRQYPAARLEGVSLLLTDSPKAPFAFLHYLFWNNSIPLQSEVGQLIFRHEVTHIAHGHTYDKLACQLITCIFWFNPFYWIIQKELNIVHEFIADEHAVADRNTETFARMLLQTYNNGSYLVPQHYFFSSTVKRRLAMLQNAAMPSYAVVRRFMVAPILALTVLLFSCTVRNGLPGNVEPAKKKLVVLLDAGHGGQDAGGKNDNYAEKDLCLKCALRIQALAPAYNVEVKLTRDNDHDVSLTERTKISNSIKPDVFVSLHIGNKPGKEKAKGDYDIYVSGKNAQVKQSNRYSTAIFGALEENGIIPGTGGGCIHNHNTACKNCSRPAQLAIQQAGITSTEKEGPYVLNHTDAPAMIVELGNINNKEGMKQLTDNDRLDVLSNAILKGLVAGSTATDGPAQNNAGCQPADNTLNLFGQ